MKGASFYGKMLLLFTFISVFLYVKPSHAYIEDIQIVSHSTYTEGYTYVVGEVKNTGSEYLTYVQIVATFYDDDNNVLASDFTYTDIETLAPNQKSPFELSSYPHEYLDVDHYSIVVADTTIVSYIPYSNFQIQGVTTYTDRWYYVQGKILNQGQVTASWIKIVATFYNSQGKVIYKDFTYADIDPLFPGDISPFELNTYPREITPASYQLQVECAEYQYRSYLDCEVNQSEVARGNELLVSGYLGPGIGSQDIVLTYRKPDGSQIERYVKTDSDGYFEHTIVCNKLGTWSVYSEWGGNVEYLESRSIDIEFEVVEKTRILSYVSCEIIHDQVIIGNKVDISGNLNPGLESQDIVLTYRKPDGSKFTRIMKTDSSGYFEDSFLCSIIGDWGVYSKWSGNSEYASSESDEISFEIIEPPPRGNIEIQIQDAEGNSLRYVQIESTVTPQWQTPLESQTGIEGSCIFSDVITGTYSFKVSKIGFVEDSITIRVSEGETSILSLEMEIMLYDIEVTVVDSDSNPVADAQVESVSEPNGQEKLTSITNYDGRIVFENVKVGNYRFYFSKEGYEYEYGNANVEPEHLSWSMILVRAHSNIILYITDMDNSSLADSSIVLITFPVDQNNITATSDTTGTFVFSDILVGEYEFKVSKEGYTAKIVKGSCVIDLETELYVNLEVKSRRIPSFPITSLFLGVIIFLYLQRVSTNSISHNR